ncbi:type II site-specific deoxyribonuclease [Yersinia enterocolitica]|jgi:hypothetical protein
MDILKEKIDYASKLYNSGLDHIPATLDIIKHAMLLLNNQSTYGYFGAYNGKDIQEYHSFSYEGEMSRPVRDDLFIKDFNSFVSIFNDFHVSLKNIEKGWSGFNSQRANKVIYTSVMSVACCFDLWRNGSRKTPGTFFEIFMAAILKWMLPGEIFSKHIPLIDQIKEGEDLSDSSSVSTDIVIKSGRYRDLNVVIPLKITTRERIVQPFAQQRILDSYFGTGIYHSFVACISETQQDKRKRKVNHICVPGTIRLYQKYLSSLSGLYYCDIPERYLESDLTDVIPVKSMGDFLFDIYSFFMQKD